MTRWRYSGSANPALACSIEYRPTKEVPETFKLRQFRYRSQQVGGIGKDVRIQNGNAIKTFLGIYQSPVPPYLLSNSQRDTAACMQEQALRGDLCCQTRVSTQGMDNEGDIFGVIPARVGSTPQAPD